RRDGQPTGGDAGGGGALPGPPGPRAVRGHRRQASRRRRRQVTSSRWASSIGPSAGEWLFAGLPIGPFSGGCAKLPPHECGVRTALGELEELLLDRGEQLVGGVVVVAPPVVAEREIAAPVGTDRAGGQDRRLPGIDERERHQRPPAADVGD